MNVLTGTGKYSFQTIQEMQSVNMLVAGEFYLIHHSFIL